MRTFSRSWHIAKVTFSVMRQDPEMLAFPVLSAITSLLLLAAFLVPTVFLDIFQALSSNTGHVSIDLSIQWIELGLLAVLYVVLAFTSTFFNVCVVHIAKTRFEGGNATFFGAVGFALSRTPQIAMWAVVSATIGLLLRQLDSLADQDGPVGMIFGLVRGVLGMAWSLIQLFVVPAMVYDRIGPIEAMKRSASTLRETWGESLTKHFGFGLLQFLAFLPCLAIFAGGVFLLDVSGALGLTVMGISVGLFVIEILVFNTANIVFNTALYHFAHTGESPSAFAEAQLETALTPR